MDNLVIFDGVCRLCSGTAQFVLRHETEPVLRFATVQSTAGRRLLAGLGMDPDAVETFVLLMDGRVYLRSDAAIRVTRLLRRPWRWLGAVRIVPRPVRDRAYDLIARNRYRWFGRHDTCLLPTPAVRSRFIDD